MEVILSLWPGDYLGLGEWKEGKACYSEDRRATGGRVPLPVAGTWECGESFEVLETKLSVLCKGTS